MAGPNYMLAMNIVNQLFDEAEVSVDTRQAINDKCTQFVERPITERLTETILGLAMQMRADLHQKLDDQITGKVN